MAPKANVGSQKLLLLYFSLSISLEQKYFFQRHVLQETFRIDISQCVSDVGMLINYAFIKQLPIEFFWIEPIDAFFGGASVYYLGK